MPAITYTIQNNSVVSVATVTLFTFVNDAGIAHSLNLQSPVGWNGPWNTYSNWTANDTKITTTRTFLAEISDTSTTYLSHTTPVAGTPGTALNLASNTGISAGWEVFLDPGYTAGQTVVSTSGTNWVITSAAPNGVPIPGSNIKFIPPDYRIRVNNTIGISPGDTISGNGFDDDQTVVSIVDPDWLIISEQSPGISTPGLSIIFTQATTPMTTIGPGATQQFQLDYTRSTSVLGTYTSTVSISGVVENAPFLKLVKNFAVLSPAPIVVPPESPFFPPDTPAPAPEPPPVPPPPRRRRRRWKWWIPFVAAVIGVPFS